MNLSNPDFEPTVSYNFIITSVLVEYVRHICLFVIRMSEKKSLTANKPTYYLP